MTGLMSPHHPGPQAGGSTTRDGDAATTDRHRRGDAGSSRTKFVLEHLSKGMLGLKIGSRERERQAQRDKQSSSSSGGYSGQFFQSQSHSCHRPTSAPQSLSIGRRDHGAEREIPLSETIKRESWTTPPIKSPAPADTSHTPPQPFLERTFHPLQSRQRHIVQQEIPGADPPPPPPPAIPKYSSVHGPHHSTQARTDAIITSTIPPPLAQWPSPRLDYRHAAVVVVDDRRRGEFVDVDHYPVCPGERQMTAGRTSPDAPATQRTVVAHSTADPRLRSYHDPRSQPQSQNHVGYGREDQHHRPQARDQRPEERRARTADTLSWRPTSLSSNDGILHVSAAAPPPPIPPNRPSPSSTRQQQPQGHRMDTASTTISVSSAGRLNSSARGASAAQVRPQPEELDQSRHHDGRMNAPLSLSPTSSSRAAGDPITATQAQAALIPERGGAGGRRMHVVHPEMQWNTVGAATARTHAHPSPRQLPKTTTTTSITGVTRPTTSLPRVGILPPSTPSTSSSRLIAKSAPPELRTPSSSSSSPSRPSNATGAHPHAASPSSATPSQRCAGFTKTGQACKRLVKVVAPVFATIDRGGKDEGTGDDRRFCKDHVKSICAAKGFYWRSGHGEDDVGKWVEFDGETSSRLGIFKPELSRR